MTESEGPAFRAEQEFLRHAARCLERMKSDRAQLWKGGGDPDAVNVLQLLTEDQRKALENPRTIAIGRIDLQEGAEYHIGPRVIWEGTTPVVISWAAAAAESFYVATPDDSRDLTLRRRLRTDYDTLLSMSDEVFAAGRADAVEPTLDDLLLEELARDRSGSMREVVATIQSEQYRIIALSASDPTVVQGGPGTGKTVVGLHRAAFLLYRNRQVGSASPMLIIGPNRVFMKYIGYVLPSLGEENTVQLAVSDLGGVPVRSVDDPLVRNVKGQAAMSDVIRAAVQDRVRPPADDQTFQVDRKQITVVARDIRALMTTFEAGTQSYNDARDRFRLGLQALLADRLAGQATTSHNEVDLRTNASYLRAVDRMWPTITPEELVRQLLSSEERLERCASRLLTEAQRRLLYRRPAESIDQVAWTRADVPLVDEARTLLDGPPATHWHVILDEAQDLTPMELRMVARRVRGGAATVLGDLAQATGAISYERWSDILEYLGIPDARIEQLTHAYRVPRQIMEAALPILEYTAPSVSPPVPFRTGPSSPDWVRVRRSDRARTAVRSAVRVFAGGGTTAVIAPLTLMDELKAELAASRTRFNDAGKGELGTFIELIDPAAAKGLEFDHVVLVEPAVLIREHPDGRGLRELYVALTRPTRSLVCVHAEDLPWPLGGHAAPLTEPPGLVPAGSGTEIGGESVTHTGEHPVAVETQGAVLAAQHNGVALSAGEAIDIACRRGRPLDEVLAAALLATASGTAGGDLAGVLLAPGVNPRAVKLLANAREQAKSSGG